MPTVTSLDDLDAAPHATMFDGAEPRTIRLSLDAGESVDEHSHPGRSIVIYVIDGAIDLSLDGDVYDLEAGDAIQFDGDQQVSPEAREDSTALVVLAQPGNNCVTRTSRSFGVRIERIDR